MTESRTNRRRINRVVILAAASVAALFAAGTLDAQRSARAASSAAPASSAAAAKPVASRYSSGQCAGRGVAAGDVVAGGRWGRCRATAQALLHQLCGGRCDGGEHCGGVRRDHQLQPGPRAFGGRAGAAGQPGGRQHARRPPQQRVDHFAASVDRRPRRHRALAVVRHQSRICARSGRLSEGEDRAAGARQGGGHLGGLQRGTAADGPAAARAGAGGGPRGVGAAPARDLQPVRAVSRRICRPGRVRGVE